MAGAALRPVVSVADAVSRGALGCPGFAHTAPHAVVYFPDACTGVGIEDQFLHATASYVQRQSVAERGVSIYHRTETRHGAPLARMPCDTAFRQPFFFLFAALKFGYLCLLNITDKLAVYHSFAFVS